MYAKVLAVHILCDWLFLPSCLMRCHVVLVRRFGAEQSPHNARWVT
jgi:hypothetical protein